MTFDVEREIKKSLSTQKLAIQVNAQRAIDRLYWMHAVGSGICGCGGDMENHPVWDNHSPTEIPRDKGYYDE